MADILFLAFLVPLFLPFFINRKKISDSRALYLFFPSGFVWISIYFFLLHVVLLSLGSTDADAPKWLVPISNDPSDFFGTFFFVSFFPLMAFYLYITRTEQWDVKEMRKHFAGHIPTRKEVRRTIVEKYERKKIQTYIRSVSCLDSPVVHRLFRFLCLYLSRHGARHPVGRCLHYIARVCDRSVYNTRHTFRESAIQAHAVLS